MPTSTAPQYDLPPYATDGNYGAGAFTWSATPRRVATGIDAWANAGATPQEVRLAQSENEWLARAQEWYEFFRNELDTGKFGDGSDGDVTIAAGATSLLTDMHYANLTVEAGATLNVEGCRVFVSGLLTVEAGGVICADSNAGSGLTAGAASTTNVVLGGAAGGAGRGNAGVGTVGVAATTALGGAGGAGGLTTSHAGAAGGAATAPVASLGSYRHQAAALGSATGGAGTQWQGGGGGGGGSCENGNTGTSGGGGGGGGVLVIFARQVSNGGTIHANGGAGAAAVLGNSTEISGGGGGGGGVVFLAHREAVGGSLGTVTATGGVGGALAGTGTAGANGSAGRVITLIC